MRWSGYHAFGVIPIVCVAVSAACDDSGSRVATFRELSFEERFVEIEGFHLVSMDSIPLGAAMAVAWLGDTLVVADRDNEWIRLYVNSGREVARLGRSGDGPGEMRSPEALAVDSTGTLWVGDFGGRLLKRADTGTGLETFGVVAPTIRSLALPFDDDRLLVAALTAHDGQDYAATIVDFDGTLLDHVYPVIPGHQPNRLNLQAFVAAASGEYVLFMDRSADSVAIWNSTDQSVMQIPIPRMSGYEPIVWPAEPIMDGRARSVGSWARSGEATY